MRIDSETGKEGIGTSRGYRPLKVGESDRVGYCGSGMKTAPPRRSLRSAYRMRGHAKMAAMLVVFSAIAVLSVASLAPSSGLLAGIVGTTPPVADFVVYYNRLTITCDASTSTDDGTIVSYDWNFGDGASGSGVNVSHTYATWGSWLVILTVTDEDAMTGQMATPVTVSNPTDPPPAPYNVWGYVLDSLGNPAFNVPITITDTNTGAIWTSVTDTEYGYYMVNLNELNETGWNYDDTIVVVAETGTEIGTNTGTAVAPALQLDISMVIIPEFTVMIVPVLGMVAIAAVVSLTRRREK